MVIQENTPADHLALGQIGAAYGIKGWVKLISFSDPADNILSQRYFFIEVNGQLQKIELDQVRQQGKGYVGHIKGCDDRNLTRNFTGKELLIEKSLLPELEEGYYWHQLEGLKVVCVNGDILGTVHQMLGTGANDVLVVRSSPDSIDEEERLIPYLTGQVIEKVDLAQRLIQVNWEKDY